MREIHHRGHRGAQRGRLARNASAESGDTPARTLTARRGKRADLCKRHQTGLSTTSANKKKRGSKQEADRERSRPSTLCPSVSSVVKEREAFESLAMCGSDSAPSTGAPPATRPPRLISKSLF